MSVMTQAPPKKTGFNVWLPAILLSGVMSGLLLFGVVWYFTLPTGRQDVVIQKIWSVKDVFPGISGLRRSQVILLMGVDLPPPGSRHANDPVRTDTMIIAKVDPKHKRVGLVSIPRDSKVYLPGYGGVYKANAAYVYGGPDLAVDMVEDTFGIQVDNYLVVNVGGIREFVDALGGVEVYVDKPMRYRDRSAKLDINLSPGRHELDGVQAEGFLRFRHDAYGDIGRVRRQQQFLTAVTHKLKSVSTLLRLKPLLDVKNEHLITDLTTSQLVQLALFGRKLQSTDVEVATIPGYPSQGGELSYWSIDSRAAEDVLNRLIIGIQTNNSGYRETDDVQPTVGLLYTEGHEDDLERYKEKLEARGYRVLCNRQIDSGLTRLVTHSPQSSEDEVEELTNLNPTFSHVQLIFSPHGGTFESNSCGRSDYTLVLGDDTRSTAQQ